MMHILLLKEYNPYVPKSKLMQAIMLRAQEPLEISIVEEGANLQQVCIVLDPQRK